MTHINQHFFVLFKVLDRSIVALKVKINWREEMSWNFALSFSRQGEKLEQKSEMEWNEHKGRGGKRRTQVELWNNISWIVQFNARVTSCGIFQPR